MKKKLFIIYLLIVATTFSKTIVFWHSWQGENRKILERIIDDYNELEEKRGSGTKVLTIHKDFSILLESFIETTGSYNGPDVLLGKHDWIPYLSLKKRIVPIEEYFTKRELANFLDSVFSLSKYKKKSYGIPLNIENIFLVYNKDYIKKAPSNFEDYIKIKETLPEGINILSYDYTNPYFHIPLLTSNGGTLLSKDNSLTYTTNEFIDSLFLMKQLKDDGILNLVEDENKLITEFKEGKHASIITGSWNISELFESGINYELALLPSFVDGSYAYTPVTSDMLMISENSPYKAEAVEFMKYLSSYTVQLNYANVGITPTIRVDPDYLYSHDQKSVYKIILEQYQYGYPLPPAPELSWTIWDTLSALLDDIDKGRRNVVEAAYYYQGIAEKTINEKKAGFKK